MEGSGTLDGSSLSQFVQVSHQYFSHFGLVVVIVRRSYIPAIFILKLCYCHEEVEVKTENYAITQLQSTQNYFVTVENSRNIFD